MNNPIIYIMQCKGTAFLRHIQIFGKYLISFNKSQSEPLPNVWARHFPHCKGTTIPRNMQLFRGV